MELISYLLAACAATYTVLTAIVAAKARQQSVVLLAGCCAVTSVWAGISIRSSTPSLVGALGVVDLTRELSWYCYLLHLYRRSEVGSGWQVRAFAGIATIAGVVGYVACLPSFAGPPSTLTLLSLPIVARLTLSVCELLLIENLYLNLPEHARWHVAVPCVVLGGLACFDILVSADTVLYHRLSIPLAEARVVTMILVAPLLLLAASRGQRWSKPIRLSREAVFHSATLVLSGSVLLSLAIAGEMLRQFDQTWGWVAELSLVFAGLIGLVLFMSSRSGRSLVQRTVVHHFFADQYDYRRQWLGCIDTLSGTGSSERTTLHTRAIRAVADVVDSPNGVLFLRDNPTGALAWAGSWNMPSGSALPPEHPVVIETKGGEWVVDIRKLNPELLTQVPLQSLGKVWLAIPLLHTVGMIGLVIVGPPRVPFQTNQEVFDLLRILGREVATYVNEQRALEVMLRTRDLHDYSKRFAFVAHDIKNVSSQLGMLLQNAEHYITNSDFQRDMLGTVRASVQKIDALLKRLEQPETGAAPSTIAPVSRLETLVATYQRVRNAKLSLEHDGSTGRAAMSPDAFDTVVTHLLNNAVEASPGVPVRLRAHHEATRIIVEIIDRGPGMSAEFVRDQLFQPFHTRKVGGSGIGAFQARELLREAGAELVVLSEVGVGTTMQMILARADQAIQACVVQPLLNMAGDERG